MVENSFRLAVGLQLASIGLYLLVGKIYNSKLARTEEVYMLKLGLRKVKQ